MADSATELDLDVSSLNELVVDFLILADRAEVVNGKLYMLGGGWDRQFVQDITQPILLSFAVGVLVPWNATNREHLLKVRIEDFDGNEIGFKLDGSLTAGRSPTATPGEVQRVILALPAVPQVFPALGKYKVKAAVNGVVLKQIEFNLVPRATAPPGVVARQP